MCLLWRQNWDDERKTHILGILVEGISPQMVALMLKHSLPEKKLHYGQFYKTQNLNKVLCLM